MTPAELQLPDRGFTKSERQWIKEKLIPAMKAAWAVQGRNVNISNSDSGQTINTQDCQPCP